MPHSYLPSRSSLSWTILSALLAVLLGDILFYQNQLFGGYLGIYGLALLALLVLNRRAVRRDGRAQIALAGASLFAVAMIFDANLLAWTLFWVSACMATLLPSVSRFDDGWRWFQRLIRHGLRAFIAPALDFSRILKMRRHASRRRFNLRAALQNLALPFAGSILIITLFIAANPVLERLATSMSIGLDAFAPLRWLLWGVLFVMVWSLLRPRPSQNLFGTFDGSGDWVIPGVSVTSVTLSLVAFNLLFALQNLMDIAYLGDLMPLPDGVTLASYAHRGAYPLIVTALLAALFVVVTLRPGSSTASVPIIRNLVVLWIGQNILLVGSSAWRTLDYVDVYSLTPLRIAALAWMALVAVGLALICWRLLCDKSARWLINSNVAAAAVVLTIFCFVDLRAVSAQWNIRHAREVGGRGAQLDLCYLNRLGSSSLLSLIRLEGNRNLPIPLRARAQVVRTGIMQELAWETDHGFWTWLGAYRLEVARRELALLTPLRPAPGERGCDGALIPQPQPVSSPHAASAHPVLRAGALTGEKRP